MMVMIKDHDGEERKEVMDAIWKKGSNGCDLEERKPPCCVWVLCFCFCWVVEASRKKKGGGGDHV